MLQSIQVNIERTLVVIHTKMDPLLLVRIDECEESPEKIFSWTARKAAGNGPHCLDVEESPLLIP